MEQKRSAGATTRQVGERIRMFRMAQGLSQEKLANEIGMKPGYIGHLERGLKSPTVETLARICGGLGITLAELFDFGTAPAEPDNPALEKISRNIKKLSDEDADRIASIVDDIVALQK